MIMIIISFEIYYQKILKKLKNIFFSYFIHMELETHNCRKCGLTISATCSKCHRVVDVKKLDDGCIVKVTKCGDCANTPVIKDICTNQA